LDPDLDALAAYVATFDAVPRSPMRNDDGTMTDAALRGEEIFFDLECAACHSGNAFTNSAEDIHYDVGTLTEFSGGRLGGELSGIDTPTLLGIWQTAPYLHDGSAATLLDVLTTRNSEGAHGDTSALSDAQLADLVAYMQQLDQGLPAKDLTLPADTSLGGMGGMDGNPPDPVSGGMENSGGTENAGGASTSGGTDSSTGGDAEEPVDSTPSSRGDDGCGCRIAGNSPSPSNGFIWWAVGGAWLALRRRRLFQPPLHQHLGRAA
jgi:MYXO-CTERM domain-containing protein